MPPSAAHQRLSIDQVLLLGARAPRPGRRGPPAPHVRRPAAPGGPGCRHSPALSRRGSRRKPRQPLVAFAEGSGSAATEPPAEDGGEEPSADTTVLLVACGIGAVTGAGVVLFNDAIHVIRGLAYPAVPLESVSWGLWARQLSFETSLSVILLPPTIGGLALGLFRYLCGGFGDNPVERRPLFPPPAEEGAAEGTREAQQAAEPSSSSSAGRGGGEESEETRQRKTLRATFAPFLRGSAAALTLGSGCSLGPEGPSVEIGRSAARGVGKLLKDRQQKMLPLLAAGSGAGVAAGFNAPISGVFFAVETVLQSQPRQLDGEDRASSALTVAMVLLACVTAATVSRAGLGDTPAFRVPAYQLQSIVELPLVMLLGSACGLVSIAFSFAQESSGKLFKWANPGGPANPRLWTLLPAIGGVTTGLVALRFPEILYQGFGNVNALLELRTDDYAPPVLLQMLAAKVFATAICRGSGLVGGIYAPSIFMGAALGSAYGGLAQAVLVPLGLSVAAPTAYALVGVAGMLAANCSVPLTAVLLLFELTQDYVIVVPTLAAVGISYWTASLPLAAQLAERLRSTSGQEVGAGAVTSVDEEDLQTRVTLTPAVADLRPTSARQELPALQLSPLLRDPDRGAPRLTAAAAAQRAQLTAQCAAESSCVMVARDTPLAEALQLLEAEGQTVALVLDEQSTVTGLLTRERILELLQGQSLAAAAPELPGGRVELTVGAAASAAED